MENYIIEMQNITKTFPGIIANDNITLKLRKGEIHALLGENGAGKSTLMSILFGLYKQDSGIIKKDGIEVKINDPNDANKLGIGMVHQHFKLIDVFTVLDNIILGYETTKFGFLLKKEAKEKVEKLKNQYGFNLNLDQKVEDITIGMQQKVEILKMLYRDNDILIFDEPTAVLTPQEITELLSIMRKLTESGKSILFITHKLNEIFAVADTVTVLRKGRSIKTLNISETTKEELSEMMVGRKIDFHIEKTEIKPEDAVLFLDGISLKSKYKKGKNILNNISFIVRSKEIVCIAGIDGNGQKELINCITGLDTCSDGNIYFKNYDITRLNIKKRNEYGIAHIPEDRQKHGLILDFTLENNLILEKFNKVPFQKKGIINKAQIRQYANEMIKKYDIRSSNGATTIVRNMSGGNQQKLIIARELDRKPELLIACQPTRGLDIGAIEFIHKQIINERDNGAAILLVSYELDEVMELADRIIVIYEGEIVGEFDPKKVNVNELGLYMSGAKRKDNINIYEEDKQ